jgi:hypothetical protein
MEKCGDKDNKYLLDTIISSTRNENETIEEFNKRFIQIVQNLKQNINHA